VLLAQSCVDLSCPKLCAWTLAAMSKNESLLDADGLQGVSEDGARNGFVRKVYGILSVQLLVTAVVAFPIQQQDPRWVAQNISLAYVAMAASLALVCGLGTCCKESAKKFPNNYIFLLLITIAEAVIVGFISAMYTTQSVLLAAALTSAIFLALTAYAMTTKTDFTGMGPYLICGCLGMIVVSLVLGFCLPNMPIVQKAYAGAGAILFSLYIVYDTQLIVDNKHSSVKFGLDDYVFAALNIYLDIINLFLYLLQLFGDRK